MGWLEAFCAAHGGPQRMPLLSAWAGERGIASAAKGVFRAWKQCSDGQGRKRWQRGCRHARAGPPRRGSRCRWTCGLGSTDRQRLRHRQMQRAGASKWGVSSPTPGGTSWRAHARMGWVDARDRSRAAGRRPSGGPRSGHRPDRLAVQRRTVREAWRGLEARRHGVVGERRDCPCDRVAAECPPPARHCCACRRDQSCGPQSAAKRARQSAE